MISQNQMKKLVMMMQERDEDICRDEMFRLTGKESRSDLTWSEASRLISHIDKAIPLGGGRTVTIY